MNKLTVLSFIVIFFSVSCSKKDSTTAQAAPTITSFSPATDSAGALLTITGTNFNTTASGNTVLFNDVPALITFVSATQIIVVIPQGVTRGTISVSTGGKTGTSATAFTPVSANQLLLQGKWIYKSSYVIDTFFYPGTSTIGTHTFLQTGLFPDQNYLQFNDTSTVYFFHTAWGQGLSGVFFKDTVNYTLKNNTILLSYPAGVNTYSGTPFNYPAYQDTITINALTTGGFILFRNYHYKHDTYASGEIKESVDTLAR